MRKNLLINLLTSVLVILVAALSGMIIAKLGILALAIIPAIAIFLLILPKVIKEPFFGFLLIIFFLPFERVPTFNFGGVDVKINTVLGFLTLFAWVLALLFNKKEKIQPNSLFLPLSLFIIALLLSLTQALDLSRAIQVLVFILFTIALSVLAVNQLSDIDRLKKTIIVLLSSSAVVGLFGLFQFGGDIIGLSPSLTLLKTGYTSSVFGFPRIQAYSMEPLFFANYLLIPISLCGAYFLSRAKFINRIYLLGLLIVLLIDFVLTLSRGAYLGLAVTILLFIFFYIRELFQWKTLAIILIVAIVGYGVLFALGKGKGNAVQTFIKHVTVQDVNTGSAESVQGRLGAYASGWAAYKWFPVLGLGIGNYGPWNANYPSFTPKGGWKVVNNEYIEILAETGTIGGITFGLILLFLLWRSLYALKFTNDPFLKATMFGLFAAFAGILTQYNFFSTLYIIHIWILIGLMVGTQNLIFKYEKQKENA